MVRDSSKQRHAITSVLTPQGPQLSKVSDLHLCEITPRKEEKKTEKERKVDIDQMRVQTNSAGVRLGIQ